MKPEMFSSTAGRRRSSVVGVASRMKSSPAARAGRQSSASSSGGRSTTISPSAPAALASARKRVVAIAVDRVVVAHQHDRHVGVARRARGGRGRSVVAMRAPAASARRLAAWIDGPSAIGSVNGMPISIRSAPAAGRPAISSQRGGEVRIARGQEGDQPRPALAAQLGEAGVDPPAHSSIPMALPIVNTSLSPRPHRFMTMIWSRPSVGASLTTWPMAWLGSSAGRMPSSREQSENAASASSSVIASTSIRPMSLSQDSSGPDARIVEPGRDRVRLDHLAVLVLQQVGALAVQDAGPAGGHRRRVLAGRDAVACGLDRDDPHVAIVEEGVEQAHGVGAAAHGRHQHVRQPAFLLHAAAPWPRCR